MESHSITCHPAEVTFPPLPQRKCLAHARFVYDYALYKFTFIIIKTNLDFTEARDSAQPGKTNLDFTEARDSAQPTALQH